MPVAPGADFANPVSSGGSQTNNHGLDVAVGDIVVAYAQLAAASAATATFDGNAMSVLATTGNINFGALKLRAWIYTVASGGTNLTCTVDNGSAATFRSGAFVITAGELPLDVAAVTEAIDTAGTSNTIQVTPVTDEAMMFTIAYTPSSTPAASTGSTAIGTPGNQLGAFYSAVIDPAAATDMSYTMGSSRTAAIAFAIKPVVVANPKFETLVEDFSGVSLPATLADNSSGGTATLTGGDLVLSGGTTGELALVESVAVYDLTESEVLFQLTALDAGATFYAGVYDANQYGFYVTIEAGGDIAVTAVGSGGETEVFSDTYDSTDHRQIRLRLDATDAHVEAADAAGSWATLITGPLSAFPDPDFTALTFYLELDYASVDDAEATIAGINVAEAAQETMGGGVTPTGALVILVQRSAAGSITPMGAVSTDTDDLSEDLAGEVEPTGDVVTIAVGFADGTMQGSVTPIGTLSASQLSFSATLAGSIEPFGGVLIPGWQIQVSLGGTITPTGAPGVPTEVIHDLAGAISPEGEVTPSEAVAVVLILSSRSGAD